MALLGQVYSGEQLDYLPAMMGGAETVVINDLDWQVIPPEDVVAAFQGRRTNLFATANTAADAQVYLEVLILSLETAGQHFMTIVTGCLSTCIAWRVLLFSCCARQR